MKYYLGQSQKSDAKGCVEEVTRQFQNPKMIMHPRMDFMSILGCYMRSSLIAFAWERQLMSVLPRMVPLRRD